MEIRARSWTSREHTFAHFDLDAGVTLGHIFDTSHHLGHDGGIDRWAALGGGDRSESVVRGRSGELRNTGCSARTLWGLSKNGLMTMMGRAQLKGRKRCGRGLFNVLIISSGVPTTGTCSPGWIFRALERRESAREA